MNYGELKAAVLSDSHRPDLDGEVVRFIREAEGMIRRDLKGYTLSTTLGEADRLSGGLYQLPATVLVIRSLHVADRRADALEKVSPVNARRVATSADPHWYADLGNNTIEIRGTPGTDVQLDLLYFGHPAALSADTDENDLLTDHESLYINGGLFFLHKHEQNRELMQDALDVFNGVMKTLNEQISRKIGGASIAPSYNFSGGSSY